MDLIANEHNLVNTLNRQNKILMYGAEAIADAYYYKFGDRLMHPSGSRSQIESQQDDLYLEPTGLSL